MTTRLLFRPVAQAELEDAAVWYESRKPGLGADFVSEIQRVLDAVVNHPERYPVVDGTIREALVSRFPYCVYYCIRREALVVLAIFHTARDPSLWKGRE